MSDFSVNLYTIDTMFAHPDPETTSLEIVQIEGYQCVVKKGNFHVGDQVFYIPEQAIVPPNIIEALGLTGMLSGPDKNRVKAVKLRKVLSQGILYPLTMTEIKPSIDRDHDYAEELNITKYEPRVPESMSGKARAAGPYAKYLMKFDFDNIKKSARQDEFEPGEPILITEKLHGTFVQYCYLIKEDILLTSSKGLSKQGIIIEDVPENENNLYIKTAHKYEIKERIKFLAETRPKEFNDIESITLMGEIVGPGVQDLTYSLTEPAFFVFGMCVYTEEFGLEEIPTIYTSPLTRTVGLTMVPLIAFREFTSKEALYQDEDVMSEISDLDDKTLREGVVISSPFRLNSYNYLLHRAKLITPAYLLRKNGTEYN